jgi:ferredoxin-NADP reductase
MVGVAGAFQTRLVEKLPRAGDVVSFRFEKPPAHDYAAGQWFVITFDRPRRFGRSETLTHHFSYSSAPSEPHLEFTTRLRGTDFKNALDALPLGTEVTWEGPFGGFTLIGEGGNVAFLAGGLGITCVRSITRWVADGAAASGDPAAKNGAAADSRGLRVFHANHSEDAIPFREDLTEFERAIPALRVVYVISQPGTGWQGYRGHIDAEILSSELDRPETWRYYVSGPPSMVQATREMLVGWGIEPEAIKAERFDGYE